MATAASSKKPKAMPKKNLVHFEKRLLEERKRVLKELGHYDETFGSTPQGADGDLSAYSFHMADQGTDAMEREKAFLLASQEGRFLWHIDEALRRRDQLGDEVDRDDGNQRAPEEGRVRPGAFHLLRAACTRCSISRAAVHRGARS